MAYKELEKRFRVLELPRRREAFAMNKSDVLDQQPSGNADIYYAGYRDLPEAVRKRLSIHMLREIFNCMVIPAIDHARALDRAGMAEGEQPAGEPVALVDEADDGLFVDILYGDNGSPLKRGDRLYRGPQPPADADRRDALAGAILAESVECDFGEGTWTFSPVGPYEVGAGRYWLVPESSLRQSARSETSSDTNARGSDA